jgi:Tol biopolymer transport system component
MPDGSTLGFRSNLDTLPGLQIYEVAAAGGTPERISSHATGVIDFHYSPDGTRIAYTGTEPADPKEKEIEKKGFNAEIYEEDWSHQNLYMLDRTTRLAQRLTKDITVHNFDWHPDGSAIAAGVTLKNLTDITYMFKRVYVIDTKNGRA